MSRIRGPGSTFREAVRDHEVYQRPDSKIARMRTPSTNCIRFSATSAAVRGQTLLLMVIVAGLAYWAGLRRGQPQTQPDQSGPIVTAPEVHSPAPISSPTSNGSDLVVPEALEFASLKLIRSSPSSKEWRGGSDNIRESFWMNVKVNVFDSPDARLADRSVRMRRMVEDLIVAKENFLRKDGIESRGHRIFFKDSEARVFTNGPLVEVRRSILYGGSLGLDSQSTTLPGWDESGVCEYLLHCMVLTNTGAGYFVESERTRRGLFGKPGLPEGLDDLRESLDAPRLDSPSKGISSSGSGRRPPAAPQSPNLSDVTNQVFYGVASGVGESWMSSVSIGTYNLTGSTNWYYCYVSTARMQVLLRELAPDEKPDKNAANFVEVDTGLWNARSGNVVLISHRGELEAAQGIRATLTLKPLE